jgi:hypothetical protein
MNVQCWAVKRGRGWGILNRMWMDMEEVELDAAGVAEAKRCLAPLCGATAVSASALEQDDEVVVTVDLGAAFNGSGARVELVDGRLVVHVRRAKA